MYELPSMITVPSWISADEVRAYADEDHAPCFDGFIGNKGDDIAKKVVWMRLGEPTHLRKIGSYLGQNHELRIATLLEAHAWLWGTCRATRTSRLLALDDHNVVARMANGSLCILQTSVYTGYCSISISEVDVRKILNYSELLISPLLVTGSPFNSDEITVAEGRLVA